MYKHESGRGGMGTVWRAERVDGGFQQTVAIKLIKRGMDTNEVIGRFAQERQILSLLDHANIARLLDGGSTEEGRPYLVMEFIEGCPLLGYCEEKQLTERSRLALFRTICEAVQHAHSHLVIHRDLKPRNVMVRAAGDAGGSRAGSARDCASILLERGKSDEGVRVLESALGAIEKLEPKPKSQAGHTRVLFSQGLLDTGKRARAEVLAREAGALVRGGNVAEGQKILEPVIAANESRHAKGCWAELARKYAREAAR